MMASLKRLAEGGALTGTPDEYIARHEAANAAREALRLAVALAGQLEPEMVRDNFDLIGG